MDKKVLRNLSYGVYVVTSRDKDKNVGCIANSIMQVTSNPSVIAVSINHDNYTNKVIKENNYIEEMFNNLGKPENLKPYFEIINRVINQKIEKED